MTTKTAGLASLGNINAAVVPPIRLTWRHKLAAIRALDPLACVRWGGYSGQYYVEANGLWIRDRAIISGVTRWADTPKAAIEALWDALTNVPHGQQLVVKSSIRADRYYEWAGFMWREIQERP